MQTFLPYSDYDMCAKVLDDKRIGNQVYREGKTLISGGWPNHPASKMWKGYEHHLALYCLALLKELTNRGRHYPEHIAFFEEIRDSNPDIKPPWMGDERLHRSHRSNLLRKDYNHYIKHFKDVPDNLPYFWPV